MGYSVRRPTPKVVGEDCRWQSARKPSDGNYVANREVSGSQNVTEPHHSPQENSLGLS